MYSLLITCTERFGMESVNGHVSQSYLVNMQTQGALNILLVLFQIVPIVTEPLYMNGCGFKNTIDYICIGFHDFF